MSITVYHNPACGTSRNTIALLVEAGHKPVVIEYLKTGWTKAQLKDLFARAGISAHEAMRENAPQVAELGLKSASEEALLEAMVAHPILVNRPIVVAPKGVRLCRPKEKVFEIL